MIGVLQRSFTLAVPIGAAAVLVFGTTVFAQERTVAITVDDLPYASGGVAAAPATAESANRKLLAAFRRHHVPVTGFVNQKTVESLGVKILQNWIARGLDLGNHTYSHADADNLSVEEIEQEILRGEKAIRPLMKDAGKDLVFFRFPFNHTGDSKEKHDALGAFLAQRGYRLATCTIDTSDFIFNAAYVRMLAKKDAVSAQKLRAEYLSYTETEIEYYAGLNRQVFGYEPPEVMLLHDNLLNSDVMEQVLQVFEKKQYRFVLLAQAQSDAAYQTPDTYITRFGPMWGYRWAAVRKIKVNGALEPDPPNWIAEYGNTDKR